MDDSKLSDRASVVENDDSSQSASPSPVTMTPVTSDRKYWGSFFAELDRAKCGSHLEKNIFRYCAERADVPISFRELVLALRGTHPDLDVTRIQNVAGKLAQKFQNGKPGFVASYHENHQTLMYVTVVKKPRVLNLKTGSTEVDLILKTNARVRAARRLDRRADVQYFAELLGESPDQVRELAWLFEDEPGSDSSKK